MIKFAIICLLLYVAWCALRVIGYMLYDFISWLVN